MSWIREEKRSWIHSMMTSILQSGPIPRHVAFIMDGNRRFATKNHYERSKGHILGFDKLAETLEWCLDIGIVEVTIYAFSIENFKRSKEEVDGLLDLARQKFARLMEEKDMIMKHGICFRVLGNINLLPLDIQRMIAECVTLTKHNNRAILNVCFSYTSRDEMCYAAQQISEGVSQGLIYESDINQKLFEKCLYSHKSSPPDLMIRTSGEVRMSDFLLWQTSYSPLSFVPVLWPEFSRWHLYAAIFFYQRLYPYIQKVRQEYEEQMERYDAELARRCNEKLKECNGTSSCLSSSLEKTCIIDNLGPNCDIATKNSNQSKLGKHQRIDRFLEYLQQKEDSILVNLLNNKEPFHIGNGDAVRLRKPMPDEVQL